MTEEILNIINFIKKLDNFLLTTHLNADGDAYAATLSTAYLLDKFNKHYQIVIHDSKAEPKYSFMWGFEKIQSYNMELNYKFDAAIILDVPNIQRIGEPANLLPPREYCVKIDHHPFEEDFAAYELVEDNASSASHLVYQIAKNAGIAFSKEFADLIFAGIMYDTGRFSFSNTHKQDFTIASELLDFGVEPGQISNYLFFNNSYPAMKTIGYGLANMESLLNDKLAIIKLPLNIMEKNNHAEIEELANYSVSIRGVEIGIFAREVEPDFYKVSFRSKGRINVNEIARIFSGGGHPHAAGCRFKGSFDEFKLQLIEKVKKTLN